MKKIYELQFYNDGYYNYAYYTTFNKALAAAPSKTIPSYRIVQHTMNSRKSGVVVFHTEPHAVYEEYNYTFKKKKDLIKYYAILRNKGKKQALAFARFLRCKEVGIC